MKAHISKIGVLDKQGNEHSVELNSGLNIITGKSSTGKSALIEIFDYCFGKEENTIPAGVITKHSAIYFVSIEIKKQTILIGRMPDLPKKAYFKTFNNDDNNSLILNASLFDRAHFIPLDTFKKALRDIFIDSDDVDESLELKEIRGQKAPTPSIRSFTSFMLQHQNLIANKHALFYRFDEKQKRDQAIEHSKIFLGFVDQKYFFLKQDKETLQNQIKSLETLLKRNGEYSRAQGNKVEPLLLSLYSSMGLESNEHPLTTKDILRNPFSSKEELDLFIKRENIKPLSNAKIQEQLSLEEKLSVLTAEFRRKRIKQNSLNRTISRANELEVKVQSEKNYSPVTISNISVCPFCNAPNNELHSHAVDLADAIKKLGSDLSNSSKVTSKLEVVERETVNELEQLESDIRNLEIRLDKIVKENADLEEQKTLYEIIINQKAQLFAIIDSLTLPQSSEDETRLSILNKELQDVDRKINAYNIGTKMQNADMQVNSFMNQIGKEFDFEDSYRPINLHFSFETFDLYNVMPNNDKVFLRSMGSGANWLYSHLSLFLGLHEYFATLGEKCAIPSILFLDQPSQVYFPSFQFDKNEIFSVEKIKEVEKRDENEEGVRRVDDDIKSVENMFSQLSIYCDRVGEKTGVTPQIIVTDHADNLTLSENIDFESFVNGNRWRDRGLIHPILD